jgi:hypothetical protein
VTSTRPLRSARVAAVACLLLAVAALPLRAASSAATIAAFTDVPVGHPFFHEIEWLTTTGIADGYPDGTFRPDQPVTRQANAAFLHRLAESPAFTPPATAAFTDVPVGHPFFHEIEWLTTTGIADGYPDGTFRPDQPVTRQANAAFLHRLVDEGLVPDPAGPPPEWFTGSVDDFYVVPDPLPLGRPGELIRLQAKPGGPAGTTTLRIMYHSRDAQHRDRAVTGTITYPNAAPPPGGWPVVSHANGTVGLISACALSRGGGAAPRFGVEGVGVNSDYIGLGPIGETHPYLSRPSEGHSVIDAVRAARDLPEANAGPTWLTIGGSQGGHGALSAHELGETYAPELELRGAVAMAPAAMFGNTYGVIDVVVTRIVGIMALYGAATEHPEIDPDDYVSETTAAAAAVLQTSCLGDIIATMIPHAASATFWSNDPAVTEPAQSMMEANDVGHVAVDTPVLLASGTADTTVVIQRSRDLFARLCGVGQVTEFLELEGADHNNVYTEGRTHIDAWLQARLAGDPAPNSCPAAP